LELSRRQSMSTVPDRISQVYRQLSPESESFYSGSTLPRLIHRPILGHNFCVELCKSRTCCALDQVCAVGLPKLSPRLEDYPLPVQNRNTTGSNKQLMLDTLEGAENESSVPMYCRIRPGTHGVLCLRWASLIAKKSYGTGVDEPRTTMQHL